MENRSPGWYPVAGAREMEAYWDGEAWTEARQDVRQPMPAAPQRRGTDEDERPARKPRGQGRQRMTWTPTDYIGTAIVMLFAGAILAGVLYAILPTVGMIAGILLGVLCTTWLSIGVIAKGVEVGIRSSSHR